MLSNVLAYTMSIGLYAPCDFSYDIQIYLSIYMYTIYLHSISPPGDEHHGFAELQHLLQHQRQRGLGRGGGGAEPGV